MSVSQVQEPQALAAADGQASLRRPWWRRLSLPSFVLGAITVGVVWVAVADLLRQGR